MITLTAPILGIAEASVAYALQHRHDTRRALEILALCFPTMLVADAMKILNNHTVTFSNDGNTIIEIQP